MLLSSSELVQLYSIIDQPKCSVLDAIFPSKRIFPTCEVMVNDQMIAGSLDVKVRTFVQTPRARVMGESLYEDFVARRLDGLDPWKMAIVDGLRIHRDEIFRRQQFMAIEALTTARVSTQNVVDFGRSPINTVSLTGDWAWNRRLGDPLCDIARWSRCLQREHGFAPDHVIVDPRAFEYLSSEMPDDWDGETLQEMKVIVFNEYFSDFEGVTQPMLRPNTVILVNAQSCGGLRNFGAILDMFELHSIEYYPKMWSEGSDVILQTQSAPLISLGFADATFCATVA